MFCRRRRFSCGVMLDVAQVVEHQFGDSDVEPLEPPLPRSAFLSERSDRHVVLVATMAR